MKNYMDLTGKIAVVTGASSGIGYAYSKALAENGAKVAAFARRVEKLEKLKDEIETAGGTCLPVACDVSNEDQVVAGVQKIIDTFGRIDILVNNAGVQHVCPAEDMTLQDWQNVIDITLNGYFLMSRECGKHMIKQQYGRIINTGSMFGHICGNGAPILPYNTSRGAIPNFTRGLAQEWAKHNITVNAIGPGEFPTEMMVFDETSLEILKNRCPMQRPGNLEDLCGQMLLFASDASAYTTGQTIYIDGGWTCV